jgi:diguanylate cyclase (GGDEF)-like protein
MNLSEKNENEDSLRSSLQENPFSPESRKMRFSPLSKTRFLLLAVALAFCCLANGLFAGRALAERNPPRARLTVGQERYEIGPYLEILEDPQNRWTIEDVSSPSLSPAFSPVAARTLNLGISSPTVWLRFGISVNSPEVASPRKTPWLLDIGWPFFDNVEAFLVPPAGKQGKIEKIAFDGDHHPFKSGTQDKTGMMVRLPELDPDGQTIYLKVQTEGAFFLYPVICTVKNYLETSTRRMLWFGLYFGILLGLLLYNLFLFFCLRDRSYLWYVTSIGTIGLYLLGSNRLTYEYLTDFPPMAALRLNLGFLAISMIALLLFVRCFLQTGQRAPLLDRVIWGTAILQVAIMVPVLFASLEFLNQCYTLTGFTLPFTIIITAVTCWRRGYRPARCLVLAWVFYGLSGVIYILTFRGLLPFTGLTFHSLQIGSAVEAVLLSFALADRINLLRREREELSHSDRRHKLMAFTDALTGLYNLRYFREHIDVEIELAQRMGQKLTLMMLDIDNFKLLNDTHGHPEGDKVLAALGKIMASCVRERDVASRYGGEEFAIILPGGRNSTAIEIYERINAEIAQYHFGSKEKPALVTLSIGVAEHIHGEGSENLILRADQALYEAKARGRNQIVIAGREPSIFFSCVQEDLMLSMVPPPEV